MFHFPHLYMPPHIYPETACRLPGPPLHYYCPMPYPIRKTAPFWRQYPDVDATFFNQSAISMQNLMKEASIVMTKFAESKTFAHSVMLAAQKSDKKEVERLIKSTGISLDVATTYTPDGINLKLSSKVESTDCCQLTIALRWR